MFMKELGNAIKFKNNLVGLFKKGCWLIPEIMTSSFMALVGIGLAAIGAYNYIQDNGENREYKMVYYIVRDNDPRALKIRNPVYTEYPPCGEETDRPCLSLRISALEELVLGILESFREVMVTGSSDLPVMDPFQTEHLHLDLGELLNSQDSHVTLKNLDARKLSTFVIDDLSVTLTSLLLQRYDFEFEGHIPVIEVDADEYDLNINALGFNLFGAGNAKILLKEPRITAKMEIALSILGGISLNLRSANVVFKLGAIEPQLTGMFDNTLTDEFVNLFLKYFIEDIVVTYEAEISALLSEIVLEIGNELLANLDLSGILGRDSFEEMARMTIMNQ